MTKRKIPRGDGMRGYNMNLPSVIDPFLDHGWAMQRPLQPLFNTDFSLLVEKIRKKMETMNPK